MGQRLTMPTQIGGFDYATLAQRSRPGGMAGGPEANVDVLYDTQTALAAGLTTLNFFTSVNADDTLSNMETAGVLPAGQYFDVWRIFVDANRLPTVTTAATAVGAINDIATILHTGRGALSFTMFNKPVGPIPLTFFGNSGSVEGYLSAAIADPAARTHVIQVGRMPDNGGWPANGTIRIPPQTKFGVSIRFAAGVTLSVDTPLRVTLLGVRYRQTA